MSVPKEVIAAVLAFRKKVKPMTHDSNNQHDRYSYVSIDKYYEQIARVASDCGLIWRGREVELGFLERQGKNADRTFVRCTFEYDVMAGESVAEKYSRITIISPINGPQTTGQLYSYADKVFMRTLGCVATGEEDADAMPTAAINPKAKSSSTEVDPILGGGPTLPPHDKDTGEIIYDLDDGPPYTPHVPVEPKDLVAQEKDGLPLLDTRKITLPAVAAIEAIFQTYIKDIKTKAKLRDWHAENLAALEKVKKLDPAAGDRIKALLTAHNKSLK